MSDLNETKTIVLSLVDEISENLSRISTDSEQGFLDLGMSLQQASREGHSVEEKVTSILDLAESDLGQDLLLKINNLIDLSSGYFGERRASVSEKAQMLKILTGLLDDLRSKNSQVEQLAKYLRAVALNIFIETSRSKALSQSFSIIADEIKQLSENILGLSKNIRENVQDSESRLMTMDKEIQQGVSHVERLTEDARSSFESALKQTHDWLQTAKNLAEKNMTVHKNIRENVGNVVMSLQFQDAMRQRLEHIVENLSDMKGLVGSIDDHDGSASNDTLAMLYVFSTLLSDQVEAIVDEAWDINASCSMAFETIREQIITVEDEVKVMMYGAAKRSDNQKKSKSALIESLQEFLSVKNAGNELMGRMKEIYVMASATSSSLKTYVGEIHQISMDAHIKALNAIIAATHLGPEGKTLSVLAGEMKGLSDLTDTFVKEVNSILEALAMGSQIEEKDFQDDGEYAVNLEKMVNTVPGVISKQVSYFRDLKQRMEEVGKTHDTIRSQVTFIPEVADDLSAQKEVLARMKTVLEPYRKEGVEGTRINDMIKERYTMEREREIHRQSLEAGGDSVTPDQAAGDEEFEDNIELF